MRSRLPRVVATKTTFREELPTGLLTEETLRIGALDAKTEADVNHGLVKLDKVADVIL